MLLNTARIVNNDDTIIDSECNAIISIGDTDVADAVATLSVVDQVVAVGQLQETATGRRTATDPGGGRHALLKAPHKLSGSPTANLTTHKPLKSSPTPPSPLIILPSSPPLSPPALPPRPPGWGALADHAL